MGEIVKSNLDKGDDEISESKGSETKPMVEELLVVSYAGAGRMERLKNFCDSKATERQLVALLIEAKICGE